jgi:hypothetical protein
MLYINKKVEANMENLKLKKEYLFINTLLIIVAVGLLFISITISDRGTVYYMGIVTRIVFGILIIFNGIWNCMPSYFSISNNKANAGKRTPRWPWYLCIALGIGMLVTAFMGYGFNGVHKPL